jgi:hypothetical protein
MSFILGMYGLVVLFSVVAYMEYKIEKRDREYVEAVVFSPEVYIEQEWE